MIRSNSIRAVALGLAMAGMLPVASSAQVTLTVVMKSGQRYTGRNLWYASTAGRSCFARASRRNRDCRLIRSPTSISEAVRMSILS